MANGILGMHDSCSHCGLKFQSAPGDFTGASVLSYAVTSVVGLTTGIVGVLLNIDLLIIMLLGLTVTVIVAVVTYQPLKGLWVAFLVESGALPNSEAQSSFPNDQE